MTVIYELKAGIELIVKVRGDPKSAIAGLNALMSQDFQGRQRDAKGVDDWAL